MKELRLKGKTFRNEISPVSKRSRFTTIHYGRFLLIYLFSEAFTQDKTKICTARDITRQRRETNNERTKRETEMKD